MWIYRDLLKFILSTSGHPIKILKGPRQVGKTSLLQRLTEYKTIYFDDILIRNSAQENPKLFFSQFKGPLILDEATLSPAIFSELKRLVDQFRREGKEADLNIWITGSNQTLLQKNVMESLAGRADYYDLNTLSLHELSEHYFLEDYLLRGGWPQLYTNKKLDHVRYLNGLISTFIERDIVMAAGIEKHEAFSKSLQLFAGRVGQLFNASDIAKNVGIDVTTVQSWNRLLEKNGITRSLLAYSSNINQRLIKTPKIYFEDVGLASRLQGWSSFIPLMSSSQYGHLIENVAISEVAKFFTNRALPVEMFYIRSKDQVEVDLLIHLSNQKYIAAEIKTTPTKWSEKQHQIVDSLKLDVVERWIITPTQTEAIFENCKIVEFSKIWEELNRLFDL
ncbi:MAG: AAA family ATPase [Bacteriovoracaceae bacterium]|nr:AAA family ATPase [Bacteriovoracaceae bacterium]